MWIILISCIVASISVHTYNYFAVSIIDGDNFFSSAIKASLYLLPISMLVNLSYTVYFGKGVIDGIPYSQLFLVSMGISIVSVIIFVFTCAFFFLTYSFT